MKRCGCLLLIFLAGLCATGCVHGIASPGATGFVMDGQTRVPLADAEVVISRVWQREWPNYGLPTAEEALANTRPPIVFTKANGSFAILPQRKWMMLQYPEPDDYAQGTVVVQHAGYRTAVIPLTEKHLQDLGPVLLTPLNLSR